VEARSRVEVGSRAEEGGGQVGGMMEVRGGGVERIY
jgi:hypothetical protein